jgi:hypothetical protein
MMEANETAQNLASEKPSLALVWLRSSRRRYAPATEARYAWGRAIDMMEVAVTKFEPGLLERPPGRRSAQ